MGKSNNNDSVRARMAPSPTGFFHIGSARTALYNWLYARHNNGKFILRVEDTDAARSTKEMITVILDALRWLGLDWDEGPEKGGEYGPYFQSERKAIYQDHANRLIKDGRAYWCYCTPEEIEKERADHFNRKQNWQHRCRNRYDADEIKRREENGVKPALRFAVPVEKKISFQDLIHGQVEKTGADLEDFVIMKSDGMATYNFACVIDDHLMKINHVIRGVEHIANTPKQVLLYEALNMALPNFAHLPVILGTDKKKLSKRLGARSVMEYKEEGYLPEALVNFLALLGWSPGGDKEIMDLAEMTKLFTLERINPANAVYDEARLLWMNNHYMINRQVDELFMERMMPFVIKAGLLSSEQFQKNYEWAKKICQLMRPRLKVLGDIAKAKYFFRDDFDYDENALGKFSNPCATEIIRKIRNSIESMSGYDAKTIEDNLRKFAEENGWKTKEWIHPLRVCITGTTEGPGLFETMELIGKEKCLQRIDNIIKKYEGEIAK